MKVPFDRQCQELVKSGLGCSVGPLVRVQELIAVRQS